MLVVKNLCPQKEAEHSPGLWSIEWMGQFIQIHSQSNSAAACRELLWMHLAHNLPPSRYDYTLQWAIKCFGASNWKCDSFTPVGSSSCGWHVLCWHLRVNTAGYVAVYNWELHYTCAGNSKPVPQRNYSFKPCPVCLFGSSRQTAPNHYFFSAYLASGD